jgi:hypothetical protein
MAYFLPQPILSLFIVKSRDIRDAIESKPSSSYLPGLLVFIGLIVPRKGFTP